MTDPFYSMDRKPAPDIPNPGSRSVMNAPDTYRPSDDGVAAVAGEPHAFKPFPVEGGLAITSGYVNWLPVTGADGETVWSVGSEYVYWVKVTTDEDGISTGATIERGSSVPEPTETEGYQAIFEVDEDGVVTSQHVTSSLAHQMCGEEVHLFGGLG